MRKIAMGLLTLVFGLLPGTSHAMPRTAHPLKGVVRSVDVEKHLLVVEPAREDSPVEFRIQEGRTRLWQNAHAATLAELSPGQAVQLYYKRELGQNVATEVRWKSERSESKPKS